MLSRKIVVGAACAALAIALALPAGAAAAKRPPKPHSKHGKVHSAKKKRSKPRRATARASRSDDRSKPIVFIHGLDAFGTAGADCGMWNNMVNTMRGYGWSGAAVTVKYYEGDTNCTVDVGSDNADTHIEDIGRQVAWMIYNNYSSRGQAVDVVGHSMGGLVIRYALAATQNGDSSFPPYLDVEDVVTLAAPHQGSGWASWCPWSDECQEIANGSSFQNWLASNARNPQGSGGTDWTAIGSYDDTFVSEGSAVGMDAAHKVKYLGSMNIDHSDYYNDTSSASDADVEWWDTPGPWYSWLDAPHVVQWSDYALTYGSW